MGLQTPANSYNSKGNDKYPLGLNVCQECWHSQLTHVVDPTILFKNYMWMSGVSKEMCRYFEQFAIDADQYNINNTKNQKTVLEIACNDGSQLDAFKKLGYKTIGVDPAENFIALNEAKGHIYIPDFFGEHLINKLNQFGNFDVIVAQNVFAHVDDIHGFLRAVKALMSSTTQVYIQTSQANMILNGEFDTLYHEHVSFFTVRSMRICLEKNDLYLKKLSFL